MYWSKISVFAVFTVSFEALARGSLVRRVMKVGIENLESVRYPLVKTT